MTQFSLTMGSLSNRSGLRTAGPVMTRGGTLLSLRIQAAIQTLSAGDGPHSLWVVNADLTLAEFEEYLEIQGPIHPDDTTNVERASRGKKVRIVGFLSPVGDGTVSTLIVQNLSMSGLRWSEESAGLAYICYNEGKAMTAGASLSGSAQWFVEWNRSG